MPQRHASPHTRRSDRDTFRHLLLCAPRHVPQPPSRRRVAPIDAPLLVAFLDDLEHTRGTSVRSRNVRLTAIHAFVRYAAFDLPTHAAQSQRVLAMPSKRFPRPVVSFLSRPDVDALLAAPDRTTWSGRRDDACILPAVQTGVRLSALTGRTHADLTVSDGAHVRVIGTGRKERGIPLAKPTRAVLHTWLKKPLRGHRDVVFPNARGQRRRVHGVQYFLHTHRVVAGTTCDALCAKRITVHRLRHTMAMELLHSGVDRSVIAVWLGHESVATPQMYLEATLAMKEQALATTTPPEGTLGRYEPGDELLNFLNRLSSGKTMSGT